MNFSPKLRIPVISFLVFILPACYQENCITNLEIQSATPNPAYVGDTVLVTYKGLEEVSSLNVSLLLLTHASEDSTGLGRSDISSSIIRSNQNSLSFIVPEDTIEVNYIRVFQTQSFICMFGDSDTHPFSVQD